MKPLFNPDSAMVNRQIFRRETGTGSVMDVARREGTIATGNTPDAVEYMANVELVTQFVSWCWKQILENNDSAESTRDFFYGNTDKEENLMNMIKSEFLSLVKSINESSIIDDRAKTMLVDSIHTISRSSTLKEVRQKILALKQTNQYPELPETT